MNMIKQKGWQVIAKLMADRRVGGELVKEHQIDPNLPEFSKSDFLQSEARRMGLTKKERLNNQRNG